MKMDKLIECAERLVKRIRYKSRLMYMDRMEGEFKGVKWRSLNPTSKKIRAMDIELELKKTRKGLHELYPDSEYLNMLLNKPVERMKYYNRPKKRIR